MTLSLRAASRDQLLIAQRWVVRRFDCDFITTMLFKTFIGITLFILLFYAFTLLRFLPVSSFIYRYFVTCLASCKQVAVFQPLLKSYLI